MERPPRPRDRPLLTTSLLTRMRDRRRLQRQRGLPRPAAARRSAGAGPLAGVHDARGQPGGRGLRRSESQPTGAVAPAEWVPRTAAVIVIVIQVAIPLIPPLADIFRAVPLAAEDWLLVASWRWPRRFSRKRSGGGRAGIGWRDRRPGLTGHPDPCHGTFGTAGRPRRSPRWSHGDTRRAPCRPDPVVQPGDRDALMQFYASLSAESISRRFHGASNGIGDRVARFFCGPDHEHREGLVAVLDEPGAPAPIIVGHLCLEPSGAREVEMAVAVADAWQRHGIGRRLLLAAIAWAESTRSTACGHRCCRRTSPSSVFFGRWGTT